MVNGNVVKDLLLETEFRDTTTIIQIRSYVLREYDDIKSNIVNNKVTKDLLLET